MPDDTHATLRAVEREIGKVFQIREVLEQAGELDPESLLISIESETNLPETLCKVYDAIMENEVYLEGLKAKIADLNDRKARIEKTTETLRGVIFLAMEKAGLDNVKHACATLTVKNTPPQLLVQDEAAIPTEYFKRPDPVLDKQKIKDALKNGATVPGVVMSNGGRTLSIRVK